MFGELLERIDGDDDKGSGLGDDGVDEADDADGENEDEIDGGGARFSFCNSFRCDVPLIIVA